MRKSLKNRIVDYVVKALTGGDLHAAVSKGWNIDQPAAWAHSREEQVKHFKGWVFAAVNKIVQGVTSITLRFYSVNEKGEEKELPYSHPIRELFRHVNDGMTYRDLMSATMVHLELTGDAYWSLSRPDKGAPPTAIWPLLPQYTKIVPAHDDEHWIDRYEFGSDPAHIKEIEPEDVVHYLYPDPTDLYYGYSPLQAAAEAVDADEGIAHSQYRFFRYGLMPGQVIITLPQTMSRAQVKRLSKELLTAYGGKDKAHRVFIAHSGVIINRDTITPREMDYLASSVVTRREVLGAFGVPEVLVGITESANRASAMVSEVVFSRYTIKPKLDYIEGVITERICPMFGDNLIAAFDDPVSRDEEAHTKRVREQWDSGILTRDEAREELGYDPAPTDGDEYKKQRSETVQLALPAPSDEAVKQEPDAAEPSAEDDTKADALVSVVWDREAEAKEFEQVMTPSIVDAMKRGAKLEETRLKKQVAEEFPEWIVALMERSRVRWDKTVGETTVKGLQATLAEGLTAGETGVQLEARVLTLFDETYAGRGTTIARTEIVSAANAGAEMAGKDAGMEKKRWIATLDEVTRPTHMAADGQEVGIDETFTVGEASLRYPGDPMSAFPEEVISCRCTLATLTGEKTTYYADVEKRFRAFEWKLEKETAADVRQYFREAGRRTVAKMRAVFAQEAAGA